MRHLLHILATAAMLCVGAIGMCGTVTLAWDANPEPDLAGYRLYYGAASGRYTVSTNTGNVTGFSVAGLPYGTYYFALTAYNLAGIESEFSLEAVASLPPQPPAHLTIVSASNIVSVTLLSSTNVYGPYELPASNEQGYFRAKMKIE